MVLGRCIVNRAPEYVQHTTIDLLRLVNAQLLIERCLLQEND
jgi:hypothetical protein